MQNLKQSNGTIEKGCLTCKWAEFLIHTKPAPPTQYWQVPDKEVH